MGWNVIPLSLHTRKPLIEWKHFQERLVTQEEVDDWFDNGVVTPSGDITNIFNLGLITGAISNLVVVDCDNDGALKEANRRGWETPISVNTTRGKHFYFRHPGPGVRVQNRAGSSARAPWPQVAGLDLRGDGGFVVMPPSVKYKDGKVQSTYTWSVQPGFDIEEYTLNVWSDPTTIEEAEFSFGTLDLSGISIASPDRGQSVIADIQNQVTLLGRALQEGDGRNSWLIRYAGAMVRQGVLGQELEDKCREFMDDYFLTPLDPAEFDRTLRSAVEMDQRNHPEDWKDGQRVGTEDDKGEVVQADPAVTEDDKEETPTPVYLRAIDELLKGLTAQKYVVEPLIAPGEITQVVGFNGHGKSVLLASTLFAAAAGKSQYGPFRIQEKPRVLYLDYDNPARTILTRLKGFSEIWGDTEDRLALWSPAIIRDQSNMWLNDPDGRARLARYIRHVEPTVVVIDTIRNAFPGLEENKAEEWQEVNKLAKTIRNAGPAVVLVHHRNKPNDHGFGSSSGSTAQLTDIDTQVYVTLVERSEEDARLRAALFNDKLTARGPDGSAGMPYDVLEGMAGPGQVLKMVQQVSFGKVRNKTTLHRTYYIGHTTNIYTGERGIVATLSPKQRVKMLMVQGLGINQIADKLKIEQSEIEGWLESASP